jgi:hypothetical protein
MLDSQHGAMWAPPDRKPIMRGNAWMIPNWDLERPRRSPVSTPSPARLYDYYLGGKDNFAVDREAAEKIRAVFPALSDAAWANRGFHGRAARWMAEHGIRQFIDIGAGLPTMENTHQVVQRITADARVVYADNDGDVVTHARALLADGPNVTAIDADVRDPDSIVSNGDLRGLIDFGEPTGLLITAVLHFVSDDADPLGLVKRLMVALAPGSYLALSHVTADGIPPAAIQAGREIYEQSTEMIYLRSKAEIEQFFAGLDLVQPYPECPAGISFVGEWGCVDPELADSDGSRVMYCGVGQRRAAAT